MSKKELKQRKINPLKNLKLNDFQNEPPRNDFVRRFKTRVYVSSSSVESFVDYFQVHQI